MNQNSHNLMLVSVLTLVFHLVATPAIAKDKGKREHRHHEAHVHGAATLQLAFDQAKGKLEFKAASEGVLGFEHQPKTEREKKALSTMISEIENGIKTMVKFDESLNCAFTKDKIEMRAEDHSKENEKDHEDHKEEGEHSDFVAEFSILCSKSPKDTKLVLDFSKLKKIKDLDVTILIDDLQKSVEIKRKAVTVDLK